MLFLQLWPFYHSHQGSHLWDWFPEPFHHLRQSLEEVEAGMGSDEWSQYMLSEYKTLNRVTLDELGEAVRAAGFTVRELELIAHRSRVPSGLDEFPLSALGIGGVKLLAVPVQRDADDHERDAGELARARDLGEHDDADDRRRGGQQR